MPHSQGNKKTKDKLKKPKTDKQAIDGLGVSFDDAMKILVNPKNGGNNIKK
jgi:hypothetical protein